jgi:hypothetical protein
MSNTLHRNAADDAWLALTIEERAWMSRSDFLFAFCLGRKSMAACYGSAELLRRDDPVPDRPFDPDRPKGSMKDTQSATAGASGLPAKQFDRPKSQLPDASYARAVARRVRGVVP